MIYNKGIEEIKKLCGKYNISVIELAMHIHVTPAKIYEVLNGKRRITPSTDLHLCKFFKQKNGHFIKMQLEYDLEITKENIKEKLEKITTVDKLIKS